MTMAITNYNLIYSLSKREVDYNIFHALPICALEQIQDFLYSQKDHFQIHVRPEIWRQSWLFWNQQNSMEEQFVMEYIFKLWGILPDDNNTVLSDIAMIIFQNKYFCDDIVINNNNGSYYGFPITNITVYKNNSHIFHFFVLTDASYRQYCETEMDPNSLVTLFDVADDGDRGLHLLQVIV